MKTKIIYTHEEFAQKGFDGEIAMYMRKHKNSAIVTDDDGNRAVALIIKKKARSPKSDVR